MIPAWLLLASLASPASAQAGSPLRERRHYEEVTGERSRPWIEFGERTWLMSGTVESRYGSEDPNFTVNAGAGPVRTGATSNQSVKGAFPILEAEFAPLQSLSIVGEFGVAAVDSPNGAVSSWVDAPNATQLTNNSSGATWANPGHASYLHASLGGDAAKTTWESASVAWRAIEHRAGEYSVIDNDYSFDLLAGAHRFKDQFTMTNAVIDQNTGQINGTPALGTVTPGPVISQTAIWQGPHLGVRAQSKLPEGFRVDGLFLYSPLMEYRNDVHDDARAGTTARVQSPNVEERAHGTGAHFRLSASWAWRGLSVDVGYLRMYYYSRTGVRRTYAPNGTSSDQELEHAITERHGWTVGATYRF